MAIARILVHNVANLLSAAQLHCISRQSAPPTRCSTSSASSATTTNTNPLRQLIFKKH
uniref:Uncharacterized protein n=1 Tax=Oryza nivara TaxID=4536 RepID=A0A0E0I2X2_ORYNI